MKLNEKSEIHHHSPPKRRRYGLKFNERLNIQKKNVNKLRAFNRARKREEAAERERILGILDAQAAREALEHPGHAQRNQLYVRQVVNRVNQRRDRKRMKKGPPAA